MRLTTPLGEGRLLFRSMTGREALGELFEFDVQALDDQGSVAPGDLLGKPACVSVEAPGGERHFHGVVCAMALEGLAERRFSYRLVLRPWLWLLTRRTDSRIFQKMTLSQILQKVFAPFSADFRFDLRGSYPAYLYKVQYRESDFAFVSRLLEQEGVYYHFEHDAGKHTMVLVDAPGAHAPCPGQHRFLYRDSLEGLLDVDAITGWAVRREIQPGQAVLQDFDFEAPKTSLEANARSSRSGASAKLEHYDYPGAYLSKSEGDRYAQVRIEELQAQYTRVDGEGSVRSLRTGHTFELQQHPSDDQNARHLVLSTAIEMVYGGHESGREPSRYLCRFSAIPAAETWRPPRLTPRPCIAGPQTAIVVGPAGEEIHTDAHGRVKVQFHWDRLGKRDADSSCWVRVSHPWGGKGWGMLALPRIGQEVVVEFLEGDPDRPLITGRVYNADQTPPYKLGDHATVSTVKSRSSKGGGEDDFNELRFEDLKGSEYVWFQAQKDYYHYVKNDAATTIDNDCRRIVGRDLVEHVKRDAKRVIDQDLWEQVKGDDHLSVDGNRAAKVAGNDGLDAKGDIAVASGMSLSLKSGTDLHAKVGTNLGVDAGANVHIKAGATLVIEAGAMITLKAGPSSVVIGPTVSITGPMVNINSGGAPGSGSGANPKAPEAPKQPQPPEAIRDPLAS